MKFSETLSMFFYANKSLKCIGVKVKSFKNLQQPLVNIKEAKYLRRPATSPDRTAEGFGGTGVVYNLCSVHLQVLSA